MATEGEAGRYGQRRSAVSGEALGDMGIAGLTRATAFARWRDILVALWRNAPGYTDAERMCDALERVTTSAESPGFWLITESACQIPGVAVRRLMAARLRRVGTLRVFAVSVQALGAEAALMRAAIRSTVVAGGNRTARFSPDVGSVASYLCDAYPSLAPDWGQRVVRVLSHAIDEVDPAHLPGSHAVTVPGRVVSDV